MKKWMMMVVAGLLAITLTACNDTAEPTEGTSEKNKSELTAEEVYTKTLEVSEKMESAEMSMSLKQKIESEAESAAMETKSDFDITMTMDPMAFHQKGTTSMVVDGETIPGMEIEMYMTDEGIYMNQAGSWIKMDNAMMDSLNSMTAKQQDPSKQLKMLEEYAKEFSFEQSDNEFILKLSADGEKFNDLIQKTMEESLPPELAQAMGKEGQKVLENMKINSMSYELYIEKETYEMTAFNMDMDMTMGPEGEAINIVQNMTSEYSNINKVDAIKVPEEVKNSAVEQPQG